MGGPRSRADRGTAEPPIMYSLPLRGPPRRPQHPRLPGGIAVSESLDPTAPMVLRYQLARSVPFLGASFARERLPPRWRRRSIRSALEYRPTRATPAQLGEFRHTEMPPQTNVRGRSLSMQRWFRRPPRTSDS